MAHPLLERAAQLIEQARALNDQFPVKAEMPAEVAAQIDKLLDEATRCRQQVKREMRLEDTEKWLTEPQYKHDMGPESWIAPQDRDGTAEAAPLVRAYGFGEPLTQNAKEKRGKAAFFDWVRKGFAGMSTELKAALVEDAQGDVLVPADFAGVILREVPRDAVIRNLAFVRSTSRNKVDIGVVNIAAAGWGKLETGATAADGLAADPADKDTITVYDLNCLVKIGVDELDDADDDLGAVITSALSLKIAEQEDDAFAAGSGTDRPQGLAVAATVTQGLASAAGETVTGDELKRIIYQVPAWARRSAVWLGHTSAEEKVALLKDAEGRYLMQPNTAAGEPPTVAGYRWYTVDGLPAITATINGAVAGTDKSVIFGDLRQGYMIADRRRLTVTRLEERYADEGKIGLLFRHRVGGAVIKPKAFAWYKL